MTELVEFDGPCPFLTCLTVAPHSHPVCPECDAVRYGNMSCPTCRANRGPMDAELSGTIELLRMEERGMGAFDGFKIGSRLILTRDAHGFAAKGDEVEVVKMLPDAEPVELPANVKNDGIRVRRVDAETGEKVGRTQEFVWECGAQYFK